MLHSRLTAGKKSISWMALTSMIAILLLSISTVLLTIQNLTLKNILSARDNDPASILELGETIEPVLLEDLDGELFQLSFTETTSVRKHLLFIFSTKCPHCRNTLPIWNALASTYKSRDIINILGISDESIETLREFAGTNTPSFKIVSAAIDTSFNRKYRVVGVPETLLLDRDGKVTNVWLGELATPHIDALRMSLSAVE